MTVAGGPQTRAGVPVAVIAGTPFDARLGADLLRARGIPSSPCPMAASPDEQDRLQYLGPAALDAAFRDQLHDLHSRGGGVALVFCNSLSAVVDIDTIARTSPLTVISPLTVYRRLLPELRQVMVLTGNGQAAVGFERAAQEAPGEHRVLAVSDPALVRAIEHGDPAEAFHASHLPATLHLAGQLHLDAVVLACTHFTAVLPLASAACTVPVIDVGTELITLACAAAGLT